MPKVNPSLWERSLERENYSHLPDLQFFRYCNYYYGLNRGVYNTIDAWFYKYGIRDILTRRTSIIAFLTFVSDKENKHKSIQFGSGGLVKKLNEFVHSREIKNHRYVD
ncbi:hypothetical protein [Aneurinibacillus danicus]|jgi:hypothetical protein|uniref:Uncharacterized protein n=1 Tax=Aneurinibacillus danicus TaxID=267746 RepID=A0A511VDG1_9BACL|nr:hypothetical protein [Aneurinibacillus danicus]GEN36869.1 hypothetical protein ADA01nite_43290 [Aneurinibacillus danicus]